MQWDAEETKCGLPCVLLCFVPSIGCKASFGAHVQMKAVLCIAIDFKHYGSLLDRFRWIRFSRDFPTIATAANEDRRSGMNRGHRKRLTALTDSLLTADG
jgi:hypothetical protein